MDPKDIQNTKFCNGNVNNITSNDIKSSILQELSLKFSLKFNENYAKLFNERYKNNLNNPHIGCLKSSGNPYLLYLVKVNNINYCLLIDKKINEGYSYPKIFIVPYTFEDLLYNGSLFECELIRSKSNNWSIILIDIYANEGNTLKNKDIIYRANLINDILKNKFTKNEFSDICNICVKKYINLNNLKEEIINISSKTDYNYRGIYFIPLNVRYQKMLYLFKKNELNDILNIKTKFLNFLVIKTHNVEIYDILLRNNENYKKIDILYIPNLEKSKYLNDIFKNNTNDEGIIIKCKYNNSFNKWELIEKINEIPNHIKDLE
jgi:hypothetical protein